MSYLETPLRGAYVIDMQPIEDERGWFSRTFCMEEFRANGLCSKFVQHNSSFNLRGGTIRGLHYQIPPYEEIKVVRCIRGKIFDVIVDIRKDSATYLKWFAVELSEDIVRCCTCQKALPMGFKRFVTSRRFFIL